MDEQAGRLSAALQRARGAADVQAMSPSQYRWIPVALLAVVAALVMRHAHAPARAAAPKSHVLSFDPAVAPADRQLVLREIASARPEARRLIDDVDGLVTIHVGPATAGGADAVGLTTGSAKGFDVTLDLATVWLQDGERGVQRLVLHELGHVVDAVLVKPDLAARLDAQIPASYGCDPQQPDIGCAPRQERFAETFAKWCTGDIGFNLPIGYKVAPPLSLDKWGAQLVSGVDAAA
jgi:hypothetical protein